MCDSYAGAKLCVPWNWTRHPTLGVTPVALAGLPPGNSM